MRCRVKEMAAKTKYLKGCKILVEITRNARINCKAHEKSAATIGHSIVAAYP